MNIHMHVLLAIIVVNSLISIVLILKHDKKIKQLKFRIENQDDIIKKLSVTVKVNEKVIDRIFLKSLEILDRKEEL